MFFSRSLSLVVFGACAQAQLGLRIPTQVLGMAPASTWTVTEVSTASTVKPSAGFINAVPELPAVVAGLAGLINKDVGGGSSGLASAAHALAIPKRSADDTGLIDKDIGGGSSGLASAAHALKIPKRSVDDISFTSNTTFVSTLLNSTNTIRALHNATALSWNNTLATYALAHADQCTKNPSPSNLYGETIATSSKSISSAVNSWVPKSLKTLNFTLDASGFAFTSETNLDPGEFLVTLSKAPEFTQLLWKSSSNIGCGRTKCASLKNNWVVVCEYWPKGNDLGLVAGNVQGVVVSAADAAKASKNGEIGEESLGMRLRFGGWRVAVGLEAVVFCIAVFFL